VTPQGIFSGTPAKSDVGDNSWVVSVSDGAFSPQATVKVKVIKSNEPPMWIMNPTVLKDAKEDSPYSESLVGKATDPDGDPITYSIVGGPQWATITADGMITGTPGAANIGLNTFKVKADDKKAGGTVADVQITVIHVNHPPKWSVDEIRFTVPEE